MPKARRIQSAEWLMPAERPVSSPAV